MEIQFKPLRIWLYFAAGMVAGAFLLDKANDHMGAVIAAAAIVVTADALWPVKRKNKTIEDYAFFNWTLNLGRDKKKAPVAEEDETHV